MDFFGNKIKKILILLGAISLCIWVVWPFLRGGQPAIRTAFKPINSQMQELLTQEAKEKKEGIGKTSPVPSEKVTSKPVPSVAPTSASMTNKTPSISTIHPPNQPQATNQTNQTNQTNKINKINKINQPATGLLDLNSATLEQLDKLPGIGESKAKAILEYRTKKGGFKRVEELMDVKGIGEKMLEKLKGLLYVAPA